ncbi:MAG: hypothetical protein ACOYBY_10625 [Dermatophilaceae bacterium]
MAIDFGGLAEMDDDEAAYRAMGLPADDATAAKVHETCPSRWPPC